MSTTTTELTKRAVMDSLWQWITQRPGLDPANYGWGEDGARAYRAEVRSIGRDLQHARELWRAVDGDDSITAGDILAASRTAYCGRLTIGPDGTIDYCTGQYWPTEYRPAAAAVLASALWDNYRESLPADTERPGDLIRGYFVRRFGRTIARRWFE